MEDPEAENKTHLKIAVPMTQAEARMVTLIDNENYDLEIDKAGKPVLLMCMPEGPDFSEQAALLRQVAHKYKDALKVCLLAEELINGFKQMLNIKGTPVFLLFCQGREKGRMLGMAGEEQLSAFLFRHLRKPVRDAGVDTSWK
jgi:hypothetical protein